MVDRVANVDIPNCKKILPLVYVDSLSYYETLCSFVAKLNEVVEFCNNLTDEILGEAKAYTDEKIAETFADVDEKLREIEQLIADTERDFQQMVDDTVRQFNQLINDLQLQYYQFTQIVNANIDRIERDVNTLDEKLDDSVTALRTEMDLKIQLNNEYLIEEVTQNLPSVMKVWNVLEGTQVTIQEMFNYLAYLHIVDGIDVQTLVSRELTVSHIVGLHRTVRDCVMYGNTVLV